MVELSREVLQGMNPSMGVPGNCHKLRTERLGEYGPSLLGWLLTRAMFPISGHGEKVLLEVPGPKHTAEVPEQPSNGVQDYGLCIGFMRGLPRTRVPRLPVKF